MRKTNTTFKQNQEVHYNLIVKCKENTMTYDEIFIRLKPIIIEHLGVKAEDVYEAADFHDNLGADSLDMIELVMAIEEEFGIAEIGEDDRLRINTVGDALAYIQYAPDDRK